MKKIIKQLVESLFNDIDFEEDEVSVMTELFDPYEVTRHFDGLEDRNNRFFQLKTLLEQFNSWQQLYDASISEHGLEVKFIDFSVYLGNIECLTNVFDELLEHNIKINFTGISLELDNTKDVYYNIKELVDFDKYNSIMSCNYFVVRGGKIRNCIGFPKFVKQEIVFDWVFGLESLEGFPETEFYPDITFEYSPFPKSWKGLPSCVRLLRLECKALEKRKNTYSRYEYTDEMLQEDLPEIIEYLGDFKDFPQDFHTATNRESKAYDWHGVDIVSHYWPTGLKKFIRTYIGNCLKKQYPKSGKLKNILCKDTLTQI